MRLTKSAVPSIFVSVPIHFHSKYNYHSYVLKDADHIQANLKGSTLQCSDEASSQNYTSITPTNPSHNLSKFEQAKIDSSKIIADLQYKCKCLERKLKQTNQKYLNCFSKLTDLELEQQNNSEKLSLINKIFKNAEKSEEQAIFLLDLIKNYSKKVPRWSELTIRMCTIWRFCSPKGYRFCNLNLAKLPSKTTIVRYLGQYNGQNQLIRERLNAEITQLKKPIERLCSLIIDDMSIKAKVLYSRADDRIYGLDTTASNSVGQRPKVAKKMLCYVIHGLSTRFTIPVGYFFHASLTATEFYALTIKIMQLVSDCGFVVLRLVTDNISTNVALFKKLGKGSLKNCIDHPILQPMPLFLSFDFCHALKNARSLFLDHDMYSSDGKISSTYLKILYKLQLGMPIKPVRYLTQKHLFPTNFEKMNVLRAVQIFSPAVTSSLKFLKESGDQRFYGIDSTVAYMENMYYFFQVHNVSSRHHYINSLDSSVAPYVHISDERLEWLNTKFQNYIDDIQASSDRVGMRGLSKETAEALKFTARSTYLCVKFLLEEVGFYYVLTRTFSSDPIEATFSHVRLKGGSNDATDARAAEYAVRQILRCGIVKASPSANTAETVSFVGTSAQSSSSHRIENTKYIKQLTLPVELQEKILGLAKSVIPDVTNIYSASVAFLAGYIIKKLEDKFHCDQCLAPLLSRTTPGPLLRLISLQDRGGLIYPNNIFVEIIEKISDIVQEALPFLQYENTCKQLLEHIYPHLVQNSIFCCPHHKNLICEIIITATVKPVLNNICLEKTDSLKRMFLNCKPISRKVLKL